tara:strand:- start:1378 stop:1857 length:480 start_codon:yes stop_codon:yes gene_type:complete
MLLVLSSCETKTVEVEVNSTGGMNYGNNEGKKYLFGSDQDNQIAVDLIMAYANKDSQAMFESMADSVSYAPPEGEMMVLPKTAIHDVVKSLHEPYDSIKRQVWNSIPLKLEGSDFTRVSVAFKEERYFKDGSEESVRLIDRIFIREGKIFRVHQWIGDM